MYACSLKKNLEAFQNHLLSEINFQFTAIAVTETRIVKGKPLNFNPNVPGYLFEYVPTPLSAGGVGIYIRENCNILFWKRYLIFITKYFGLKYFWTIRRV
jgi:hypothetical protein